MLIICGETLCHLLLPSLREGPCMVHDIEDCRWDCPTVEIGAELPFLGVLNLGVIYQERCSVSVVM